MRVLDNLKKIFVLAVAAASVSIVSVTGVSAQSSQGDANFLSQIAKNTFNILEKVNSLPNMLVSLTEMAKSLIAKDDSDETASIQQQFANFGIKLIYQNSVQKDSQQALLADMLGVNVSRFTDPKQFPSILRDLPYINDLAYTTLLNAPPVNGGERTPFNYIRYIAGTSMPHAIPKKSWAGKERNIKEYTDYFKAITAIQSYNTYLLTSLVTEATNPISPTEDKLIQQATNSDWIADIATQEIGKVLRQILLYESQNYVLNVSLRKSIRQMVVAQAMSNTLSMINNRPSEDNLARKAKGLPPSSGL